MGNNSKLLRSETQLAMFCTYDLKINGNAYMRNGACLWIDWWYGTDNCKQVLANGKSGPATLFSVKDFPSKRGQATRQNDSFGLVAYPHLVVQRFYIFFLLGFFLFENNET